MSQQSYNPNPDDRSDNKEKLQEMVQNTLENIHEAEEAASFSSEEDKRNIASKNKRRKESLEFLRSEIHDEAPFSKE